MSLSLETILWDRFWREWRIRIQGLTRFRSLSFINFDKCALHYLNSTSTACMQMPPGIQRTVPTNTSLTHVTMEAENSTTLLESPLSGPPRASLLKSSLINLGHGHTCWWEGQSQAPTSREPLFEGKSGAAATGRKVRAACPFAGSEVTFREKTMGNLLHIYPWFGRLLSSTS